MGELCGGAVGGGAVGESSVYQPGSPLQSVPTSPTACSSACAPSSSLSRYSNPG